MIGGAISRRRVRFGGGLGALVLAAGCSPQASPPPDEPAAGLAAADSIVSSWIDERLVPGAVMVITTPDSVLLERSYGWAEAFAYGQGQYPDGTTRESNGDGFARPPRSPEPVPMTTATAFDLASVTKVMATTFAVMLLVDEGEIDLDAPLESYLDGARGSPLAAITPRQLLTHRSGVAQWKPLYYHAAEPEDAIRTILSLPLDWEIGAERHYSDLGFMLLGAVVEAVADDGMDEVLRERLYQPLALTRTEFTGPSGGTSRPYAATSHGNPYERRMVYDSTFGYRIGGDPTAWDGWRRRVLSGEVNDGNAYHAFEGVAGHAGLFSTGPELAVLLRLLLSGGEVNGTRLVSAELIAEFLTSTGDGQALGWQVPRDAPPGSFSHAGFTGTFVAGVPARGIGLVLLTNRQHRGVDGATLYPDVGPLQRQVMGALVGTSR